MSSGAPDPWSINYFDPPTPHVPAPAPRSKTPRLIPEEDRLFQVQRNALLALNALDELERVLGGAGRSARLGERDSAGGMDARSLSKELRALRVPLENTYRTIRSYLDEYLNN